MAKSLCTSRVSPIGYIPGIGIARSEDIHVQGSDTSAKLPKGQIETADVLKKKFNIEIVYILPPALWSVYRDCFWLSSLLHMLCVVNVQKVLISMKSNLPNLFPL